MLLTLLNSKLVFEFLELLSPILNFESVRVGSIPVIQPTADLSLIFDCFIAIEKSDWDSYENSWGFTSLPLLHPDYRQPTLKFTYQKLRAHWQEMTLEMQRLEEENNRIFIEAYGLEDELSPEVPLNEITLTCNPHYRYGNDKSEEELEALLLADTMKEFISYAVGCMFGRYSLDKPGLILANQGETVEDYRKQIPDPTSLPMKTTSFRSWTETGSPMTSPSASASSCGSRSVSSTTRRTWRSSRRRSGGKGYIRNYFLKEFYREHVKRYKKRPIYWLFSSPKGSFNALIYMHRYRPDTVSVVLNEYLREFNAKLSARKNHGAISISADSPGREDQASERDRAEQGAGGAEGVRA